MRTKKRGGIVTLTDCRSNTPLYLSVDAIRSTTFVDGGRTQIQMDGYALPLIVNGSIDFVREKISKAKEGANGKK